MIAMPAILYLPNKINDDNIVEENKEDLVNL
jgi:hypothetical protein